MEDWILRNIDQQDWLSLVFLFNFFLLVTLKLMHGNQFHYFIRIIDSALYFKIYGKDKLRLQSFTILGTVFLLVNFSLLAFYFFNYNYSKFNSFTFFLLLLAKIICLVVFRYLFLQFSFKVLNIKNFTEVFQFKSLTYQIQISILTFMLFLLYQFSFLNIEFFNMSIFVVIILYLTSQITLYKKYWLTLKYNLLYLILYLCTFKLAPWIVLYSTIA